MQSVIGIIFKEKGHIYYFQYQNEKIEIGSQVIVETDKGLQFGWVKTQPKEIAPESLGSPLKPIIRIATPEDIKQHEQNIKDEQEALAIAKKQVNLLKLPMKMIDANFLFDRKQLLFHFVADERIDFRELAKKLAQIYKTRIELRQIGVRDKAKKIGGLGPCGRFLCCNSFLTEFDSVSINMAKNQYISLNPTKINGVCGRLLCCLKYEDQIYTDLKKELPPLGKTMETSEGKGKIISVNVFKKEAEVELPNHTTIIVDLTEGKDGTTS